MLNFNIKTPKKQLHQSFQMVKVLAYCYSELVLIQAHSSLNCKKKKKKGKLALLSPNLVHKYIMKSEMQVILNIQPKKKRKEVIRLYYLIVIESQPSTKCHQKITLRPWTTDLLGVPQRVFYSNRHNMQDNSIHSRATSVGGLSDWLLMNIVRAFSSRILKILVFNTSKIYFIYYIIPL